MCTKTINYRYDQKCFMFCLHRKNCIYTVCMKLVQNVSNIVEGYSHVYDARQRRIGGGVSIYIDLRIPYRIRSDLKLDNTIFESIFIEVDKSIFSCKHNVILAAIYKPPNVNIDIFNKHLEKMLVAIQKERKYSFLIGDYNINTMDELRCKSTLTNEFINLMSLYSYSIRNSLVYRQELLTTLLLL